MEYKPVNTVQHSHSHFKLFYLSIKSLLLGMKWAFNTKICKCLVSYKANMSNFHPLEVVDRGSETQLKVGVK